MKTGATSGIGRACAEELADTHRLILCGRRRERLEELKEQMPRAVTLQFDVRDKKKVDEQIGSLPQAWQTIDVLINNAGNAHGLAPIQSGDFDDWEQMIDINVKGLLYVTRAVLPGMLARKQGHIVNIGSIAGKETYPGGNVYCASKHAVDALNNGMRMDLFKEGIKVSQVNPGLVETEFSEVRFKGDKERAKSVYEGFTPLTGKDIAELVAFVISRPAHVNISDTIVFPAAQAASTLVNRQEG